MARGNRKFIAIYNYLKSFLYSRIVTTAEQDKLIEDCLNVFEQEDILPIFDSDEVSRRANTLWFRKASSK